MSDQQTVSQYMRSLIVRRCWTHKQAAEYFGVPPTTMKNWIAGTRTPSASTIRLIEVLGVVEAMAPAIHEALMPKRVSYEKQVKS